MRLPPAPNADKDVNKARTIQFGEAPATIAKIEQINKEVLKASLLPMMSAENPQKSAPANIPQYTAMVKLSHSQPYVDIGPSMGVCARVVIRRVEFIGSISGSDRL